MILFLHNRYRTRGGEERVVEDLLWLVREHLHEDAELLARGSAGLGRARAAAGLLRGGLAPQDVATAVRMTGARVVHAHNLHPTLGWRALAAARAAGARVVLHLHNYRLVCAVGTCFTRGEECTRCHARDTLPGIRRNCRDSRAEALTYGAALALWQRRLVEHADAVIVPSAFARERLRALGAPLPWERVHVLAPPLRSFAEHAQPDPDGYALVVSRLAREKGVDVAIDACRLAGIPLVVAGDGPQRQELQEQARGGRARGEGAAAGSGGGDGAAPSAGGGEGARGESEADGSAGGEGEQGPAGAAGVRFVGRVGADRLAELRRGAAVAVVPSRSAETFGIAAAEAMAAGLPVAASRVGALPELLGEGELVEERRLAAAPGSVEATGLMAAAGGALVPAGDAAALAAAIGRVRGDADAARRGLERVRVVCAPQNVAEGLASLYE